MPIDLVEIARHLLDAPPHPEAVRLFAGRPEIEEEDIARAGVVGDRGHDAAFDYSARRTDAHEAGIGAYLRELAAHWDVPTVYSDALLSEESVQAQLDLENTYGIDFEQAVWVLDVTVAATAFCHLLLEGRLDQEAKAIVAIALRRRLHPLVLEGLGAEPSVERTTSVERLAAAFAAAASLST